LGRRGRLAGDEGKDAGGNNEEWTEGQHGGME
jgi:hypothetical protein